MKKDKNQLLRLQTMIENDRVYAGDNFLQLVSSDINKLLRDYFDFTMLPELKIEKQNDGYFLSFNLKVARIKNFATVPKENVDNY